ncbi:hypothetical protein PN36_30980 [Candidatus Thiomargarita nelsonii]|uniref:Uncharacterized protein n=1 Tax=Candidatus Thiomargarita nelsonii TaxID=1003181 RepID=A0A4E0QL66_9GAMM|nr:hypothetical protein PN36_30980 [Candidatus Thiomargarita nelsonii]
MISNAERQRNFKKRRRMSGCKPLTIYVNQSDQDFIQQYAQQVNQPQQMVWEKIIAKGLMSLKSL